MRAFCPNCSTIVDDPSRHGCTECGSERPSSGFPQDPLLGEEVVGGQYRVLSRVGSGTFGVVYAVETVVGKLKRALKVLNRHWVSDPVTRDRFVNEALVLEQVNHPNVARCYAAGTLEDGELYLLLELIEGVRLDRLIRIGDTVTRTYLDPVRAIRLARQIASGLLVAHENGVLHRDLKPENILVTDAGSPREQVKVVDFGIAKLTEQGMASTQNVIGTPLYMAPEQFTPGATLDARVDLWQLGATLFTMLTGFPPYGKTGKDGRGEVMALVGEHQEHSQLGPAPSSRVPEIGKYPALDMFVRRLLASDPAVRPSSAAEVSEELARIAHVVAPSMSGSGSMALLDTLCAKPSESAWLALCGYVSAYSEHEENLVAMAERLLDTWPDHLRPAPSSFWAVTKRGAKHPLWPLVRSLDLSGRGMGDKDVQQLAENPALATIYRLDLSNNDIGNDGARALAACPHLSNLRHLDLSGNRITAYGIKAIGESDTLSALRSLSLAGGDIGEQGARAIARSRLSLDALDLSKNELRAKGAIAIAESESFRGLRTLGLAGNRIGPEGAAAIATSEQLRQLRVLDLTHNNIGASGAAALALSQNVRHLRHLGMGQNKLGKEGLLLLLASANFENLESIDLSSNHIGATGSLSLAGSPIVRKLRRLDVSDNSFGDTGVAALLGSAHLGGLRSLNIAQNDLTPAGAALLTGLPPQLEVLEIGRNPLGNEGGELVAEAVTRARVNDLDISRVGCDAEVLARIIEAGGGRVRSLSIAMNPIGFEGAKRLALVPDLDRIESLDMHDTDIGAMGMAAFAGSPYLGGLRALDISDNKLGEEGFAHLIGAAYGMPRLEKLVACNNEIGPDGATAVSASAFASRLHSLDLSFNRIGDDGADALARGTGWRALRVLSLRGNQISMAGATSLFASMGMGMLQRLDLSQNPLTGMIDMHSLGNETIALMEASFAKLAAHGSEFVERFYDELFSRYPSVKPLFANTDMRNQRKHLLSALVMVIDNLRNPDQLEGRLQELGLRHMGYGTYPSHYFAVSSTILDVLGEMAGDLWTDELRDAWSDGLDAITAVMLNNTVTS